MPIPEGTDLNSTYTGNDIAYQFSYYFRVIKASDLIVQVQVGVAAAVTLTKDVDYTYTANNYPLLGGVVTLIDADQAWMEGLALKSNSTITLKYNLAPSQTGNISGGGTSVYLEIEKALDRLTQDLIALQDLVGDSTDTPSAFPSLVGKAGKLVRVNAAEDAFEYEGEVTEVLNAAIAAAASAAEALVSMNQAAMSAAIAAAKAVLTAADRAATVSAQGDAAASALQASQHAADAEVSKNTSTAQAVISTAQAVISTAKAAESLDSAGESLRNANLLLYTSIVDLTFADSPYQVLAADVGKLFRIDTAGGNFDFRLPTMEVIADFRVSVVKLDNTANTITISPTGADTVDGAASEDITAQTYGRTYYQNTNSDWQSDIFIDNSASITVFGTPGNVGGFDFTAVQNIAAGGQIIPSSTIQQWLDVRGNGGPQDASLTPFTSLPTEGYLIVLQGQDDTKILTIFHNNAPNGCVLKGDCYLGANDALGLVVKGDRLYEIFRSVD